MSSSDFELKIDTKAAQEFLDMMAATAKNRFAIAKAGDVVFIELHDHHTVTAGEVLRAYVNACLEGSGVRAVLLPRGVTVAKLKQGEG